jgi:hypothetical protein
MQKEINKENINFINENFEVMQKIIDFSYFYDFEIDLFNSFGLMAQYNQSTNGINSIIKNEIYIILKKLAKEIKKIGAYSYFQNRYSNEIREFVESAINERSKDYESIYKETIIELTILMPEIPFNKKYIKEIENEVNEICENETYIDRQKEVCKYIKKEHKEVYRTIKIFAYLDYLHFLKRVETKPETIQTELDKKYINSRFETKKNQIKDVTYKFLGKQTELDKIHKNIKNYLHSDTNKLTDFKAIFSGKKLEEIKPLKINFTYSEIIYFVQKLMDNKMIKTETNWNRERLLAVFKQHNGQDFGTKGSLSSMKSQKEKYINDNNIPKIDKIFK